MIHLEKVARRFGAQVLFEELSWMIPQGSRLGLVGPNGAGKTTLLRLLSGRDVPDTGAVHKSRDLQVAYLPQEVEAVETGSVLAVVLAGFAELSRIENELEALERRWVELSPGDPLETALKERYGELRHRFEALEGDRLEARAKAILSGLGIHETSHHRPIETLSGGWRMRVLLARLLLGEPGLLLMDEPTNHLDLEAIAWLESFLSSFDGSFVIVSHDRYFLNRMARGIVELEGGKLTSYVGDYDAYLIARREREEALSKAAKQQSRELAKVERFIERFRYKNTKARQVQSRVRALGKIERIETAEQTRTIRFDFPPAPRSGDVVVRAEGVVKRFGDLCVYDGMDLLLRRGDRVALVGPNGAGKSTLLKLLAGRLTADGGNLSLGHNVHVHYYAQHQLDALDPRATVLEEMEQVAAAGDRPRLRKLLGCFLFTGNDVDKRVEMLSGGEKARLALARLLTRPANLLLMDEPTNHLDLRSREVLEEALDEYEGTLVVISHDRYFINRVVTCIGEVAAGRVILHPGDYDEYLERQRHAGEISPPPASGTSDDRQKRREDRRREAEDRNLRYRERVALEQTLAPIEQEIAGLEQRVRELEQLQMDAGVYRDPARSAAVNRDKADVLARLARLYGEWESKAAEFEEPQSS